MEFNKTTNDNQLSSGGFRRLGFCNQQSYRCFHNEFL